MNPVISAQAIELCKFLSANEAMKANLFMEQSHLPYDVQDLILAALRGLEKLDDKIIEEILEAYCQCSSFDERLLH